MVVPETITDLISYGKDLEISHRTLNNEVKIHDKKTDITCTIPFNAIVNKYRDFFDQYVYGIEFNEAEKRKYRFAPKRLSQDLYGTTEYWSIILYINECATKLDFDTTKMAYIYLVDGTKIKELINELLIVDSL